jgi:hypothetical protein
LLLIIFWASVYCLYIGLTIRLCISNFEGNYEKFLFKNSFVIIIALTCLIALLALLFHTFGQTGRRRHLWANHGKRYRHKTTETYNTQCDTENVEAADGLEIQEGQTAVSDEPQPVEDAPSEEPTYSFTDVPADYFDDALFIGDSRTVGISEYGGLDNADFFADIGMSVYTVFTKIVSVEGSATRSCGLFQSQSMERFIFCLESMDWVTIMKIL